MTCAVTVGLTACASLERQKEFAPTPEGIQAAIELANAQPGDWNRRLDLVSFPRPATGSKTVWLTILRDRHFSVLEAGETLNLPGPLQLATPTRAVVDRDGVPTVFIGDLKAALLEAQASGRRPMAVEFEPSPDIPLFWNWVKIFDMDRVFVLDRSIICFPTPDYGTTECANLSDIREAVMKSDRGLSYGEERQIAVSPAMVEDMQAVVSSETYTDWILYLELPRRDERRSRYLLKLRDLELTSDNLFCGAVSGDNSKETPLYRRRFCANPEMLDYLVVMDLRDTISNSVRSLASVPFVIVGATVMLGAGVSQSNGDSED